MTTDLDKDNMFKPLNEKQWLDHIQKRSGNRGGIGSNMRKHRQKTSNFLRSYIPIVKKQIRRHKAKTRKKQKKKQKKRKVQKGRGFGVVPRKRVGWALGSLKPIKRNITKRKGSSKKKKKKPPTQRKNNKKFGLFMK